MKKVYVVMLVMTTTCFFAAAATSIQGDMEVRWPTGSFAKTQHMAFSCVVQQNGWRISTRQHAERQAGHRELATDGTNLFSVRYLAPPPTTNKAIRVVRAKGTVSRYDDDTIPVFLEDFSHALWLAYCRRLRSSSEFHDSEISSRIIYDMPPTNLYCTASWNLNDLSALEELNIFNPGVNFGMTGKQYPLSAPFSNGFLAARFEGTGFTNVGNAFFPQKASWSVLTPRKLGAVKEDLEIISYVEVRATSISQVPDEVDLHPVVPVLMSVDDYRFEAISAEAAVYATTNGWWSPTDKQFTDAAAGIVSHVAASKVIPPKRKLAMLAFFIVVLAPALLLFYKNASKRNANSS